MRNLFWRIRRKLEQGDFWSSVAARLAAMLGTSNGAKPVDRWHFSTEDNCHRFLEERIAELASGDRREAIIFGDAAASVGLVERLRGREIRVAVVAPHQMENQLQGIDPKKVACIASAYLDVATVTRIAKAILADKRFVDIPFEYVLNTENYRRFSRHDRPDYHDFYFVGPLLKDEIDYLAIYEESLRRFEQKCDIRDYLDLCQLIREIVINKVPGDIAEFGAFRGHSGYLISRLIEAWGSDKTLFMFDTFQGFPDEAIGVDKFWSRTHEVNFAEVQRKFHDRPNVRLVKGEFGSTLPAFENHRLSFAYIDCDSYRATRFLLGTVFPNMLESGGYLACEDYGHPALLGSRLAIDEYFDSLAGCSRFFSQFSGIYIVHKG